MDVIVKLTVPNFIYTFYRDASRNVSGSSPEALMSDALSAYAGLLSREIAAQCREAQESDGNSTQSISL